MAEGPGGAAVKKRRGAGDESGQAAGGESRRGRRGRKRRRKERAPVTWKERITTFVFALVIFFVVRLFLIQTFVITSGSMEGTLLVGDFLVVNRAAMGSRVPFTDIRIPGYSDPRRGDVLVFDPPHEDTLILVKRLVGMPGDTIEMRDKAVYLNGEPMDEPYAVRTGSPDYSSPAMMWQNDILLGGPRADYAPSRDNWGPLVIPEGRYLMLGDNRDNSLDGRAWGLLERWRFEGRAMRIYFSYERDSFRPFPWIREVRWGRIGDGIR